MNEEQQICPCCPNHCTKENLNCGRGKNYFRITEQESTTTENYLHDENHFHHDSFDEQLLVKLKMCNYFMRHHHGEHTGQKHILLVLLEQNEDIISQRQLQEILGIQAGSLSEILAKIEATGWITRQKNADDKRQIDISLTESGKIYAEQMQKMHQQRMETIFACFDDDEKHTFAQLLDKLLDSWHELAQKHHTHTKHHRKHHHLTRRQGRNF